MGECEVFGCLGHLAFGTKGQDHAGSEYQCFVGVANVAAATVSAVDAEWTERSGAKKFSKSWAIMVMIHFRRSAVRGTSKRFVSLEHATCESYVFRSPIVMVCPSIFAVLV